MNKGQKSIYNAFSSISLTLINGLLGLIVTRYILLSYGSDFNGLNSAVNQFINILLVIEGGFTLATNVALFKPLQTLDYVVVNSILSATKKIFLKIGTVFLLFGIITSLIYSYFAASDLSYIVIFLTFLMTVISTFFNLSFATKYKILLQTEMREYIINFISAFTITVQQILIILIINYNGHMLTVRFITMIGNIVNSILIAYVCKKNFKYMNFKVKPDYSAIKGTKDVMIQKLTSIIYNSFPMVFLSVTVGTMYTSVYAVYNSIILLIKSFLYSFVDAPRIGFGKLLAQKEISYVKKIFIQYEFIVIFIMNCLVTTMAVLIIPFVRIYTKGINDINYINWNLAIILVLITFFEVIHIPSGTIINMSGNFKISKYFQSIASVVLIVTMTLGNIILGFYGILIAILITSIILALLEIGYIHVIYFPKAYIDFAKLLFPNVILSIFLIIIEIQAIPLIVDYFQFAINGMILVLINGFLSVVINIMVNKELTIEIFKKIILLIPAIRKK